MDVVEEKPKNALVSIVTGEPYGPRVRLVDERAEEESSDDEPESESDDESRYLKDESLEVPSEFWHMQKLIKYMKAGNQTATTVSLCLLKDFELNTRVGFLLFYPMHYLRFVTNKEII